ncbi:BPSL0761 family protein [Paraburkholderia caribensis]|uniref:BPSL0761 family protein n=1 Tax=Paraburkholderia caribensis TaxID=75105 RepID=UPI00055B6022
MTIPEERTEAVIRTRLLLQQLTLSDYPHDWNRYRLRAEALLRHYPTFADLDLSARALPLIWAPPDGGGR